MTSKRITLRIPEHLHSWVAEIAEKKGTTVTGEIISIIRVAKEGNQKSNLSPNDVREIVREELQKLNTWPEKYNNLPLKSKQTISCRKNILYLFINYIESQKKFIFDYPNQDNHQGI